MSTTVADPFQLAGEDPRALENRTCLHCGETKPLTEFPGHVKLVADGGRARRKASCKACVRKREVELDVLGGTHAQGVDRMSHVQLTYGDDGVLVELRRQAGDPCDVCGKVDDISRMHIDHDHATGKIRGLLCQGCNTALGYVKDNPLILRALALYLEANQ